MPTKNQIKFIMSLCRKLGYANVEHYLSENKLNPLRMLTPFSASILITSLTNETILKQETADARR